MSSRVEENLTLINNLPHQVHGKPEDIACKLEIVKIRILKDISKSLALIADNSNKEAQDDRTN